MKIYQILKLGQTINNNENVNKIILINLLNKDLAWLYANLHKTVSNKDFLEKYLNWVKLYASGFPLAYIFGYVFFCNQKILVNKNVLIPRPETEILVEKTLLYSKKIFSKETLDVLDLGTGSGCIALSLACFQPKWNFIASDVSKKALTVALSNQKLHQANNIKLVHSDLFANLNNKFDVIVSNPPYIDWSSSSYQINNLIHEPELALFANNSGLQCYQRIFNDVLNYTKKEFLLAFEIGFDQKPALEEMLVQQFDQYFYWFEKDYQNHWRFLFISSKLL